MDGCADVLMDGQTDGQADGEKFSLLFYRTSSPLRLLPCLKFSIIKDRPQIFSNTLCPTTHFLGSQYSKAEGIADPG